MEPSYPLLEALPPCGLKSRIQQSTKLSGWEARILKGVIKFNRESSHFHFHPSILAVGKTKPCNAICFKAKPALCKTEPHYFRVLLPNGHQTESLISHFIFQLGQLLLGDEVYDKCS